MVEREGIQTDPTVLGRAHNVMAGLKPGCHHFTVLLCAAKVVLQALLVFKISSRKDSLSQLQLRRNRLEGLNHEKTN
jgi:hypothetical protein